MTVTPALLSTPSTGKGAADESFPVAWLLPGRLRQPVMAYYAFARLADDWADSTTLSADEKITRLDALQADLQSASGRAEAVILASVLTAQAIPQAHATDLLAAFRQDAGNPRCQTWDDLIDYCRLSAMPVGRFLLSLCNETDERTIRASNALCATLQILNHVQDCRRDMVELNRCYMPLDWLSAEGLTPESLTAPCTSPAVQRLLDRVLTACDPLIAEAATLPPGIQNRFLRAQAAATVSLAKALRLRLRTGDPLARTIKPLRRDWATALVQAIRAGVWR